MISSRQPENIKICPGCGTNLMDTARQCAVCGYTFAGPAFDRAEETGAPHGSYRQRQRQMQMTISLPVLIGLILLTLAANVLLTLGLQKREETKNLVYAVQITSTYIATVYVSPTATITPTGTPAPPTLTPIVNIEYTVLEGDSCISIADKFDLYVDSLLAKNDIDCALLNVGAVLIIPQPTPTPIPTGTTPPIAAP